MLSVSLQQREITACCKAPRGAHQPLHLSTEARISLSPPRPLCRSAEQDLGDLALARSRAEGVGGTENQDPAPCTGFGGMEQVQETPPSRQGDQALQGQKRRFRCKHAAKRKAQACRSVTEGAGTSVDPHGAQTIAEKQMLAVATVQEPGESREARKIEQIVRTCSPCPVGDQNKRAD